MSTMGSANAWSDLFPDYLVPEIIDLVLSAWDTFPNPAPDEYEVPITRRFREHLRKQKNSQHLPFTIWPESDEADPDTGKVYARLDLRFTSGYREEVYFAIECKRLNVVRPSGRSSLAGPYVVEGMIRFVDGKYASGLDKGAMLGYVMDGMISDAVRSVDTAIKNRTGTLQMRKATGLARSSFHPKDANVRETEHQLKQRVFTIHHLFVGLS